MFPLVIVYGDCKMNRLLGLTKMKGALLKLKDALLEMKDALLEMKGAILEIRRKGYIK